MSDMPQVQDLPWQQVQKVIRENARKNVALERILSIVGEDHPAGQLAKEAMRSK